jgi:hypothetical protein
VVARPRPGVARPPHEDARPRPRARRTTPPWPARSPPPSRKAPVWLIDHEGELHHPATTTAIHALVSSRPRPRGQSTTPSCPVDHTLVSSRPHRRSPRSGHRASQSCSLVLRPIDMLQGRAFLRVSCASSPDAARKGCE